MRKGLAVLLAAMLLMAVPVVAQDEGPGLEGVTGDPGSYWGQTVTFEGVLVEYINPYSFVLGEGAALDDDRVLVINDTGALLPATLIRGERIRVTGVVLPSIDARDADPNAVSFVDGVLNDTTRLSGANMGGTGTTDQGTSDVTSGGGTAGTGGTGDTTSQNLTGTAMPETPLAPTPEGAVGEGQEGSTMGEGEGATPGTDGGATGGEVTTTPDAAMTGVPEMTMEVTPMMEATPAGDTTGTDMTGTDTTGMEPTGTGMGTGSMWEDGMAFYWNGNLPDDLNAFTIVRLINITDVEWLPGDVTP